MCVCVCVCVCLNQAEKGSYEKKGWVLRGEIHSLPDSFLRRAKFRSPEDRLLAPLCHFPKVSVLRNLGNDRKGAAALWEG